MLANDYDPEGAYMMVNVVNPPQNGTLQMGLEPNAGPGAFVYTPNPGFTGVDVFTYRVFQSDQHQETADIGQVSINVTDNVPPDAVDDAYSTNEETPLSIAAAGVLANDTDGDQLDAGNLRAALATGPARGSVTVNQNGSFAYTPAVNFAGTDSFTYTTTDLRGTSDTATVRITVNQVNDAPDAVGDAYATYEDAPLTVGTPGLLGNDTDPDGDALVTEVPPSRPTARSWSAPTERSATGPRPTTTAPTASPTRSLTATAAPTPPPSQSP